MVLVAEGLVAAVEERVAEAGAICLVAKAEVLGQEGGLAALVVLVGLVAPAALVALVALARDRLVMAAPTLN